MPKKKLKRFRENLTFSNLFQLSYKDIIEGFHLKGNWKKEYFRNEGPIVLELGCGKGEYTTFLASKYPDKNFVGLDIKGARLWRGCKTAIEENLLNVAFIRARIELINLLFAKDEVDEIWLTFPDPQLKQSRTRKRLSSPFFLEKYTQVMKDKGLIHLKTDNEDLYNYTLELVKSRNYNIILAEDDIYGKGLIGDMTAVHTFYEKMFLDENMKIKYLEFELPHER